MIVVLTIDFILNFPFIDIEYLSRVYYQNFSNDE